MSQRVQSISNHLNNGSTIKTLIPSIPAGPLLQNQVAIITGSGQGIGESTAKLFAQHGAKVVVTDIDGKKADKVVNEIRSAGGEAIAIPGDVTDPTYAETLIKGTVDAFGKINHIVNNAGFTFDGMIHRMSDKQWDTILQVHNTAPFRIIKAAAPYLRINNDEPKTIVNVSSTSGLHGNVGQVNYSCAKAGVIGLTKTVAKEWGLFNVRCNAIAFGFVDTRLTRAKEDGESLVVNGQKINLGIPGGKSGKQELSPEEAKKAAAAAAKALARAIPLARPASADEAAGGVLFLASPLSSYVTGATLEVTGGAGI